MIINSGESGDPPTTRTNNFQSLSLAKKAVANDLENVCPDENFQRHNLRSALRSSRRRRRTINGDDDDDVETHLHYKSGVIYDGHLKNNLKFDYGVFLWPNGDSYTGQFYLNMRNGHGMQTWSDGSSYEGHFEKDKRSGAGMHKSNNGEIYEGSWFLDYRHGLGKYKWNDLSFYEGMFFMNEREGYGSLKYSTGDNFTGLYKKGVRYGPGILEYSDTNESDIGFWYGDKLVRLLVALKVTFEFDDVQELDKTVDVHSWKNSDVVFDDSVQNEFVGRFTVPRIRRNDDPYMDKVLKERQNLHLEYLRSLETAVVVSSGRDDELKLEYPESTRRVEIPNLTKVLKEIYKHFKKYDIFNMNVSKRLNIDLNGFEISKRETFSSSPGLLETNSLEFLNACYEANVDKIDSLKLMVNIDVCDNRGYSGLILAALRCNTATINYLLDNGANINHQLDNGLTALMISVIRYYTGDKFLPNIALKHRDLVKFLLQKTLTRKISPESLVVEKQTELVDKNLKIAPIEQRSESKQIDLESNEKFLNQLLSIIELLLRRGADPSLSCVPYPALCFAIAAGDLKIARLLIQKGADVNKRMPKKYASLTPLCLACGVLGETGPELVRILLDGLADPNACADVGDEYLSMCDPACVNDKDAISEELLPHLSGRTPLHIACMRNDEYAPEIIKLLLEHSANANFICNGHSPLSLAIASGNKDAIDLLLKSNQCDPNMPLTNGNGSALCVISSTLYEHNWQPQERTKLIDKMINYGADILQPIVYGARNHVGSVVDYAYYMYNADARISRTPYHSLTAEERDTHNARKQLLAHLSKRFREKIDEREQLLLNGIDVYPANKKQWGLSLKHLITDNNDLLKLSSAAAATNKKSSSITIERYCSSCGRSVGVKLSLCSRCKKVYYCSNSCKQKAWDEWHKDKCQLHESHRRNRSKQSIKKQQTTTINSKKQRQTTTKTSKFDHHHHSATAAARKISINPDYNEPENYSFN